MAKKIIDSELANKAIRHKEEVLGGIKTLDRPNIETLSNQAKTNLDKANREVVANQIKANQEKINRDKMNQVSYQNKSLIITSILYICLYNLMMLDIRISQIQKKREKLIKYLKLHGVAPKEAVSLIEELNQKIDVFLIEKQKIQQKLVYFEQEKTLLLSEIKANWLSYVDALSSLLSSEKLFKLLDNAREMIIRGVTYKLEKVQEVAQKIKENLTPENIQKFKEDLQKTNTVEVTERVLSSHEKAEEKSNNKLETEKSTFDEEMIRHISQSALMMAELKMVKMKLGVKEDQNIKPSEFVIAQQLTKPVIASLFTQQQTKQSALSERWLSLSREISGVQKEIQSQQKQINAFENSLNKTSQSYGLKENLDEKKEGNRVSMSKSNG